MFGRPSQAANVLTLVEAKKKSSFVIWRWSNNRMQRSAVSIFEMAWAGNIGLHQRAR